MLHHFSTLANSQMLILYNDGNGFDDTCGSTNRCSPTPPATFQRDAIANKKDIVNERCYVFQQEAESPDSHKNRFTEICGMGSREPLYRPQEVESMMHKLR